MKAMITRQRSEEAKKLRRIIGDHVPFCMKEARIIYEVSCTVTTLCTKDNQIIEIYEPTDTTDR